MTKKGHHQAQHSGDDGHPAIATSNWRGWIVRYKRTLSLFGLVIVAALFADKEVMLESAKDHAAEVNAAIAEYHRHEDEVIVLNGIISVHFDLDQFEINTQPTNTVMLALSKILLSLKDLQSSDFKIQRDCEALLALQDGFKLDATDLQNIHDCMNAARDRVATDEHEVRDLTGSIDLRRNSGDQQPALTKQEKDIQAFNGSAPVQNIAAYQTYSTVRNHILAEAITAKQCDAAKIEWLTVWGIVLYALGWMLAFITGALGEKVDVSAG